jgi:hypothetical protein
MPARQIALILIGVFLVVAGIGFPLHLHLRGKGWARSDHAKSMALQMGFFMVPTGLFLIWVNAFDGS